jgi:hypothetical protein
VGRVTVNLDDVRVAVAARITSGAGLPSVPYPPGTINVPCSIILPAQGMSVDWAVAMDPDDTAATFTLRAVVLVAPTDDKAATVLLDGYLATEGPSSVRAALRADPTCGGVLDYAVATAVTRYGMVDWGGVPFLSADIAITAAAE